MFRSVEGLQIVCRMKLSSCRRFHWLMPVVDRLRRWDAEYCCCCYHCFWAMFRPISTARPLDLAPFSRRNPTVLETGYTLLPRTFSLGLESPPPFPPLSLLPCRTVASLHLPHLTKMVTKQMMASHTEAQSPPLPQTAVTQPSQHAAASRSSPIVPSSHHTPSLQPYNISLLTEIPLHSSLTPTNAIHIHTRKSAGGRALLPLNTHRPNVLIHNNTPVLIFPSHKTFPPPLRNA